MEADLSHLENEKLQLLNRLAEIMVEEQRAKGTFDEVPHYSVLEQAAHSLGQELSRTSQRRSGAEVAALIGTMATCPTCERSCRVTIQMRNVASIDGPVELPEAVARCPECRRDFFPSA